MRLTQLLVPAAALAAAQPAFTRDADGRIADIVREWKTFQNGTAPSADAFTLQARLGAWAWPFVSAYDYTNRSNDVMAVAYPATIATYYTTVLRAGSSYVFNGTFPDGEGVFQCSLTVYNFTGDQDETVRPRWGVDGRDVRVFVNASDQPRWALQRFYVKPELYSREDIEASLLEVRRDGEIVPPLAAIYRAQLSEVAEDFVSEVMGNISAYGWPRKPTEFHFNGGSTSSLFPERSHVYAVAFPVDSRSAVITGRFNASDTFPYMDFSIGDQSTTELDDGAPFYALNRTGTEYCLEVLAPDCPKNRAVPTIKWSAGNRHPLLLARLIAYNFEEVDYRRTRTPEGSKRLLGDMYPEISFAPDCSARCPA